jgi:hypothetical protein
MHSLFQYPSLRSSLDVHNIQLVKPIQKCCKLIYIYIAKGKKELSELRMI